MAVNNDLRRFSHGHAGSLSLKLAALPIPVELAVRVDSVGLADGTVPSNVKEAENYYRRGLASVRRAQDRGEGPSSDGDFGELLVAHANHARCSDFRLDRSNGPAPVLASGLTEDLHDKI